jgi:predicted alpha/beta hydrolase
MQAIWIAAAALLCAIASSAMAEDRIVRLDTRGSAKIPFYYMKREGAVATLVLLPGGSGGFGSPVDGKPSSNNFLVRTRDEFAAAGFNVAVMSRPSDQPELGYNERLSDWHMDDIRQLVRYLKSDANAPVWLVSTSRGTVSATAAAIRIGAPDLAGVVLSSSVVAYKFPGALPKQDLAAIRIPVLIVHHEADACHACLPHEVPAVLSKLKNAPIKKLTMLRGGGDPTGDPCEALHHHGYIGQEAEAVKLITDWIKTTE